ncbi:MAG: hypothetical protein CMH25_04885 [Micavibrio sp.]|nr:hypothetical protein [Micavibrio sp.]|tara:strand:- start:257 stop:661 length:405 start_codon:yes stop_codon:yes gene_type:complete
MHSKNYEYYTLQALRERWGKLWKHKPHGTMGRNMMIASIRYKEWEERTGGLNNKQREQLKNLVSQYKRNNNHFDAHKHLKPGTRLVRVWKGKKYCVLVKSNGYEYYGTVYNSLSKIANEITGSKWNGWLFFGLK